MPNQDLLYSILPRPPIAPGSGDFHRDIPRIEKEPVTKKTEIHKDPAEHSPQDDYHPHPHSQDTEPESDQGLEPEEVEEPTPVDVTISDDGKEHVDLFV
jgi:hypothetical protein